jgi:hypothetical protein
MKTNLMLSDMEKGELRLTVPVNSETWKKLGKPGLKVGLDENEISFIFSSFKSPKVLEADQFESLRGKFEQLQLMTQS